MKKAVDYSKIRGFNYTQPDSMHDADFWAHYKHDIVDRDLGYAEKIHLNCARIFLSYNMYEADPKQFLANVKDFVQTAWKHGIATNPIIFMGWRFVKEEIDWRKLMESKELRPLSKAVTDPTLWYIGENYVDELIGAIGGEPGLLFWDIANEPGYTDNFVTWYDEEPAYVQDFAKRPDMEVLRDRQEKTWAIVRHFLKYVKSKDPDHDVGVGNIFIFETEPSKTADLVDVIVFHDYSSTRKRLRGILEDAKALGEKYGKPVLDNEMGCIGRANPYDFAIQLHDEYQIGWCLFELMIGVDGWNRVHGIFYPDGTVRDPSIAAAAMGIFRNRTETAIRTDVDQEEYVTRALILAERARIAVRQNKRMPKDEALDRVLEVAEFTANLLEGGELIPMAYPPTAKIAAMRRRTDVDVQEALDYMEELLQILIKACHYHGGLEN